MTTTCENETLSTEVLLDLESIVPSARNRPDAGSRMPTVRAESRPRMVSGKPCRPARGLVSREGKVPAKGIAVEARRERTTPLAGRPSQGYGAIVAIKMACYLIGIGLIVYAGFRYLPGITAQLRGTHQSIMSQFDTAGQRLEKNAPASAR